MKKKIRILAEQFLIVANIFIAFLLLFENKLIVPAWLQPVGRMHPLLLHFPIVLLVLAMCMDFFLFNTGKESNHFYRDFSQKLLLAGALLAAVTIIMGLFLSREEGYEGKTLQWHKWTGVATFFFASVVYWIRNASWYKPITAKAGSLIVIFMLIVAGHFGASLTHGENFILQPVTANIDKPPVPIEQAIVFEDVIKPIFEKKCAACHNPDKMKGELILIDSASILKGGKTGKLFVPGDPGISLLLRRIHLPEEEKKHMPPAGKPQLTEQEALLVTLWINENADFNKKVTALPANDSLRLAATAFLQPSAEDEKFDFPPADEKTIAALNNNYRTIRPIAKESPALEVNIYNAALYTIKQLQELNEIKKQVVSLNLNKLPVTDEDLKSINKFENLRKLELNFTNITGKGLKELSLLKYLRTLTLSGTRLNYQELKEQIPAFKELKTITVWNTGLSDAETAQLQKNNMDVTVIAGFKDDGKDTLTLNPPQVKNSSMVFDQQLAVQLKHPVKAVQIRYTTDGTIPDSIKSPVFDNTTILDRNTSIKAKAYKDGWHSSDIATFDFYKSSFKPDSARLLFPLNPVHQADGAHTFFDTKLGVIGANNPAWANNWAAVRDNDMVLVSLFKKPVTVSSVGLHYMIEEATGIFPPEEVEVWGGENENQLKLLVKMKPPLPAKGDKPVLKLTEGEFKPQTISCLKIIAKPHQKKKDRQLLLVDEMFIN